MPKVKHECPNYYSDIGANGGCYFEISQGSKPGLAELEVGWSCVRVHTGEIPITWLAEIIAIATGHEGGIAGFLKHHEYGGPSYALMCDPEE
jgi:hypothetical protein